MQVLALLPLLLYAVHIPVAIAAKSVTVGVWTDLSCTKSGFTSVATDSICRNLTTSNTIAGYQSIKTKFRQASRSNKNTCTIMAFKDVGCAGYSTGYGPVDSNKGTKSDSDLSDAQCTPITYWPPGPTAAAGFRSYKVNC